MADYYPPVGFYFKVMVQGFTGDNEGSFQEVSGLSVKMTPLEVTEGGENRFVRRLPTPPKYENLMLKRGMLQGSPLISWAQDTFQLFKFTPKVVTVYLMSPGSTSPISVWQLVNAYPVALNVSPFKAEQNNLVIETLELTYDYFTKTS
ncbi:glycerol acyltransferase [Chitinophaga sp. MD30]|nr:glycerol acyltransferase [Chitinophaga sp. MD30]